MASSVIIVGAGISGLAAARTLAQAGVRVIVLEAATRLGGRIFTVHQHGHTLELGAEFLHGTPPDLWALVEDAEAETQERTGSFLTRTSDGKLISLDEDEQPGSEGDDALESLKTFPGPDLPFLDYARSLGLSDTALARELGYVEGFNAADAREVSSLALGRQQQAEDAIEGDRLWRLPAGYNHLPAWLAAQAEADGAHIRLGTAVTAIDWSRGHATVTIATGELLEATHVLLTLPLGVLQAGDVRITPEPREHLAAAVAMRMGHVFRASLVFSESLWPPNLSFLLSPALEPSVWWTVAPGSAPILTAWTGGPRSAPLLALPPAELEAHLLDTVATALDLSPAAVRRSFVGLSTHNWSADPLFRGAYSWVPVGGLSASETLATPVEDTLFFAGEHTDTSGHWGTVHAALRSGVRAARQVLGAA